MLQWGSIRIQYDNIFDTLFLLLIWESAYKKINLSFCQCRCLVIDLASSFVETADENLVNTMFDFINTSLLVSSLNNFSSLKQ